MNEKIISSQWFKKFEKKVTWNMSEFCQWYMDIYLIIHCLITSIYGWFIGQLAAFFGGGGWFWLILYDEKQKYCINIAEEVLWV